MPSSEISERFWKEADSEVIIIKSDSEVQKMVEAGALLGQTFDYIKPFIVPGVTTLELDRLVEKYLRAHGAKPSFKEVEGYHSSICASVNDVLIHGIPSSKIVLKEGDILSIDMGDILNGFQGDAARTYAVGAISPEASRLIQCTEECFYLAFSRAKAGNHIKDLSSAISEVAAKYGYATNKDYGGHGIGREMHEDPFIPNFNDPFHGLGAMLRPGMCIAVEPMIQMGTDAIRNLDDGWGVASADGKLTCHYENTIVIMEDGIGHITTIDSNVKGHLGNVER
ncbi:MAG: type I methionyl aminopeptidase [Bacilli bacterium]|jgi:methionyl aminopeptidase|nr:type I methionyl aminopeptidase [Bacilli bacterium]